MSKYIFVFLFLSFLNFVFTAPPLKSYKTDPNTVTVSGISAGGAMAIQMHVAYSSSIKGVGSLASPGPYYCAQGLVSEALTTCMQSPSYIDVQELITETDNFAADNKIDSTSNLRNSKVFIMHGNEDLTIVPEAAPKIREYYQHYQSDIAEELSLNLGHGIATLNYGNNCPDSSSPYINKCGYSAAYNILKHMYSNIQEPPANYKATGEFLLYDQIEFQQDPSDHSFDDDGYIYVPADCEEQLSYRLQEKNSVCEIAEADRVKCGFDTITEEQCIVNRGCCWRTGGPFNCFEKKGNADECAVDPGNRQECGFSGINQTICENGRNCCWKEETPYFCFKKSSNQQTTSRPGATTRTPGNVGDCKVHVVFHGCIQGSEVIADEFVKNGGYKEVADYNKIILLFPQVVANTLIGNMNGCYDWWGYEDIDYAVKNGEQMQAVNKMIQRVLGK